MKNLLTLVFLFAGSSAWSQASLSGKNFTPNAIEINGAKQAVAKDSIPFILQFIDNQNMVYKEMKSNYYVLHHCTYKLRGNKLQISFLNKNKPSLDYEIQSFSAELMVLREPNRTITLSKTSD